MKTQQVFMLGFIIAGLVMAGCKDMGTEPQSQSGTPPQPPAGDPSATSFALRVLPIFQRHGCTGCHGGSGGLTVTSVAGLLNGGDHGAAVIAGQADNSNLIRKLSASPPFGSRMPLGGPYLPDTTVNVIRAWINEGAKNN